MTQSQDPFDFGAFISQASNPDAETRNQMLNDAVSDELDTAMGEIAPRIWCILQEAMQKDPKNNIHHNAVLNSALFAIFGWLAICTPESPENDQQLRDKVAANIDNALKNARPSGKQMAMIAHNVGKMKLMEDQMQGLASILVANSSIIKGIHTTIRNQGEGKA